MTADDFRANGSGKIGRHARPAHARSDRGEPNRGADGRGMPDARATERADKAFDRRIAAAFDRMAPSAEAEGRMLAALLAGCGEDAAERARRRTRRRIRRVLVPAAACLVLLVGAGAFAYVGSQNALMGGAQDAGSFHAVGDAGTAGESAAGAAGSASDGPSSADGNAASGQDSVDQAGGEGPQAGSSESAAPSEPEGASGGAAGDADARYPFVELASGATLRVAIDDAGRPLAADPSLVGPELERATARDGTGLQTVACTVFATRDEAYPYAVRYGDGDVCYLAAPA